MRNLGEARLEKLDVSVQGERVARKKKGLWRER